MRRILFCLFLCAPASARAQLLVGPQTGFTSMPRGGFGCSLGTPNPDQTATSTDLGLGLGVVEKVTQLGLLWMRRSSPDTCGPQASTLQEDDLLATFRAVAFRPAQLSGEPVWIGFGGTFGVSFLSYDNPETHSGHQSYPWSLEASGGVPLWSYGEGPAGAGHHFVLELLPTLGWRFDTVSTDRGDMHLDGPYFHLGLQLTWKPTLEEADDEDE